MLAEAAVRDEGHPVGDSAMQPQADGARIYQTSVLLAANVLTGAKT